MDLSLIVCDRNLIVSREGTVAQGMKGTSNLFYYFFPVRLRLEDKMIVWFLRLLVSFCYIHHLEIQCATLLRD